MLLKRTNADGTWTVYAGGAFEKNSDGSTVKYYGFGGRPVALRKAQTGGGSGTVSYLLTDHLGSAAATTNAAGTVVSSQKYWPYGATRSGAILQTDKLYTGQQQEPGDSALGLYNYKARFYSTTLGRFVSADPISRGSQGLNKFTYASNNPLRWTDPTGLAPACAGCLSDGWEEAGWENCISGPTPCSLGRSPLLARRLHWVARYADLIRAQASFWGVDAAAILAIVAVESEKSMLESLFEAGGIVAAMRGGDVGFWAYAWLSDNEPDYGIGNVTVSALQELEMHGFPKLGSTVLERIGALEDPATNIMVVAALLAYYQTLVSPLYDPRTRTEHAMLIYVAGSTRYTLEWQPGGKYLGPSRGNDGLYHPTTPGYGEAASASVNRFLIIIDQARTTVGYCETAAVC